MTKNDHSGTPVTPIVYTLRVTLFGIGSVLKFLFLSFLFFLKLFFFGGQQKRDTIKGREK